ncbi:MAG: LicD family protein [Candidatus Thorarchaeota archaeon]|jgi:hypothetical protein
MGKKRRLIATPETLESDLRACKDAFKRVKIPWVITDGIVLGYARDGAIIPWDTDMDIAVFVEVSNKKFKFLHRALSENGFRIKKHKKDFMTGGRKSPLNLWFHHKNGKYYESFPPSTPKLKFIEKAKWYDNPQLVEFLGSIYPMPNHIEDYLNCRYGHDWKTNIKSDPEEVFLEKKGSRSGGLDWADGPSGKHGKYWPKILRRDDTMEEE